MAGVELHIKKLLHRIKLLSRLIRVARIAGSGLFNRAQYRRNYPGLSRFWARFPITHYVLIGERMGYAPFENFDPLSYTQLNDDVARYRHGALIHYIRHGRAERRFTQSPLDAAQYFEGDFPPVTPWPKSSRFAVVVHVFYPDVWREIAQHLNALPVDLDVIATVPDDPEFDQVARAIVHSDAPRAHVVRQPNVGRDVLGFIHLVNSGALSRYDAVCKLHTKKSLHLMNGAAWRQELIEGLLPSSGTDTLLEAFLQDESAQMLVPDRFLYRGDTWWSINKPVAERLVEGKGMTLTPGDLNFAAGSMFWCKPKVLNEIRHLAFLPDQFVVEKGQLDGTTAHAFERLTGFICARVGGRIAATSELSGATGLSQAPVAPPFKMVTGPVR